MKIIHIINSLKKGGAEGNLFRLCKFQKKKFKKKIDIIIITLINYGFYESQLKKSGIKIYSLDLDKKNSFLIFIKKILILRKLVIKQNPDIIQSWMYHSNFITLFLPKIFYEKVLWNIRHSELNLKISKKTTILLSIICGLFSKIVPKKIIYCSKKSIKFHENKHYYKRNKTILIENGYSHKTYITSKYLGWKFRKRHKLNKSDILLGFAGRYAKQKNIPSLLVAFSKLIKNRSNIYLLMVGKNIEYSNNELSSLIVNLKIKNKVFLLHEQKKLLEFYNGIDLLVLPSYSESFPNVIAESMLCGTPVLASDAGCSKKIINNFGFTIMNNDHGSILRGLNKSINLFQNKKKKWKLLQTNSRLQIKDNFSIEKMANMYLKKWILE